MFSNKNITISVTGLIAGACFTACGIIACVLIAERVKLSKRIRATNALKTVAEAMGDAVDKLPEKKTEK